MSAKKSRYTDDNATKEAIREAARGKADLVLRALGLDTSILDEVKRHRCPGCGQASFRVWRADECLAVCNKCDFTYDDIFDVVEKTNNCDFPTAKKLVAEAVGYSGISSQGKGLPQYSSRPLGAVFNVEANEKRIKEQLTFYDQSRDNVKRVFSKWTPVFCGNIPPTNALIFDLIDIQFVKRKDLEIRKWMPKFGVPIYSQKEGSLLKVNWVTMELSGEKTYSDKDPKGTRSKALKGKGVSGLFLSKRSVEQLSKNEQIKDLVLIRVEGLTDFLSMVCMAEVDTTKSFMIFSNSFGAGQVDDAEWFRPILDRVKPSQILLVGDNDSAGMKGVVKWAQKLEGVAPLKIVQLPKDCNDFRDYINSGKTFQDFLKLAADATEGIPAPEEIDIDDPFVLAQNNIDFYQGEHGGRLAYYRGHYYKYKAGCWVMASADDIKNDLCTSINRQFTEHYKEQLAAWKAKSEEQPPKKKRFNEGVLRNTDRALRSLVKLPSSVEMPCWLTDDNQRDHTKSKSYVAFQNGIIDLDRFPNDGYLLKSTPNWFSLATIQYDFSLEADCPKWLHFLEDSLEGDRERISLLQEFAAYILEPNNRFQKMLVLEGDGQNGKSVFMAGLQAMIGPHNYSAVTLEQFSERFAFASTYGKLANFAPDQDDLAQLHEGRLKQFTGGDAILIEKKNEQAFQARATAKLVISWNNRPKFRDRSKGIWRRMILVPFKKPVASNRRINGMDSPEFWASEAPGILLWALSALPRLRTNGFTNSAEADKALDDMKRESNPTAMFFDEFVVLEEDEAEKQKYKYFVYTQELYRAYVGWADQRSYKPLNQVHFGREVLRHFPDATKTRNRNDEARRYIYAGVRLRSDDEVEKIRRNFAEKVEPPNPIPEEEDFV